MKKKIITAVFASLSAFAILAVGASAEGINMTDDGKVTVQSKEQGVYALQFSLDVKASDGAEVSFEFDGGLTVRIADYRYSGETGVMNVYVADNSPLFDKSESLNIGKIKGGEASIVENSFKFVDGAFGVRLAQADNPDNPDNPDTPDTPVNPGTPDTPISSDTQTTEPENTGASDNPVSSESQPSNTENTEETKGSDIPVSSGSDITSSEASAADNGNDGDVQNSQSTAAANGNDTDNDDPDPGTGVFNEATPILITVMFASILAASTAILAKRSRKK